MAERLALPCKHGLLLLLLCRGELLLLGFRLGSGVKGDVVSRVDALFSLLFFEASELGLSPME